MSTSDDKALLPEKDDISLRGVLLAGGGLVTAVVVTFGAAWGFFELFEAGSKRLDAPPPRVAEARVRELPPEPRLQVSPPTELRSMGAEEDRALERYGWIDRDRGIVRIPIDRAIDLLLEDGLPAREAK